MFIDLIPGQEVASTVYSDVTLQYYLSIVKGTDNLWQEVDFQDIPIPHNMSGCL